MLVDRNGVVLKRGQRVRWHYLYGVVVTGETRPHVVAVKLDRTPDEETLINVGELEAVEGGEDPPLST